jgi:hypothetical protein
LFQEPASNTFVSVSELGGHKDGPLFPLASAAQRQVPALDPGAADLDLQRLAPGLVGRIENGAWGRFYESTFWSKKIRTIFYPAYNLWLLSLQKLKKLPIPTIMAQILCA